MDHRKSVKRLVSLQFLNLTESWNASLDRGLGCRKAEDNTNTEQRQAMGKDLRTPVISRTKAFHRVTTAIGIALDQ
jgi:hypothetical protein